MYLRKYGPLFLLPILVAIATFFAFDRYLGQTSRELLGGWLKNEAVSIQEGQILSAIAKHKRALDTSDFLRGIWLLDDSASGDEPRVLADFGEKVSVTKNILPLEAGKIVTKRIGLFHRIALFRFPLRRDLIVAFNIEPAFAGPLFAGNIFAILMLLAVFGYGIRKNDIREAGERLELIKSALNALAAGAEPTPELVSQVPNLVGAWKEMQGELKSASDRQRITFSRTKLGAFAKQASHDLRSPFTALDVAIKSVLGALSEEKRIEIRDSMSGLRDLIYSLHEKSKSVKLTDDVGALSEVIEADASNEPTLQLLPTLVQQQLSISRLQYKIRREISITAELGLESYGIFARVNPGEFRRMLANLITNAVEAIEQSGSVAVALTREASEVVLRVRDTGKGIPIDRLPTVGEPGVTDKPDGSGSGVHFTKAAIKAWGGSFEIQSTVGQGTSIEIRLPEAQAPAWYVPEVKIPDGGTIVVLDDDLAIHGVWRSRIEAMVAKERPITVLSYVSIAEMTSSLNIGSGSDSKGSQRLYLCDYELAGSPETGLDAIERLGLASQAILVTSHSDDQNVIDRCLRLGCRILPKSAAGLVPLKITAQLKRPDYVLIDDDTLTHRTWTMSAKEHDKVLSRFFSVDEFLTVSDDFDRTTPIYVDSDFGDGIKGEEMARYIHTSGFRSIYLQTGNPPESFTAPMPWIKAIVGKVPPWVVLTWSKYKILLVDDDPKMTPAVTTVLGDQYELASVGTAKEAIGYLFHNQVSAALVDIGLPDINGLDLLKDIKRRKPELPIVVLTGEDDYRLAVESMRRGAADYVQKGTDEFADELRMRLERAIATQKDRQENSNLKEKVAETSKKHKLIGASPAIFRVIHSIKAVRDHNTNVLIKGEHGTGKENVARQLNERDGKARKFVDFNCAAFPRELVESELFGHKKGAFTTAVADRKGKLLAADGGDLFLDEIGELPLELQPKLLRALEDRMVTPVGSETPVPFNVRLICATNRDLAKEVAAGRFRADLYYRISTWPIEVPPLRNRLEDISLLVPHLLEVVGFGGMRLTKKAMDKLKAHDWPGNVRALRNCLEHAGVTARVEGTAIIEPSMIALQHVKEDARAESHYPALPFFPTDEASISAANFEDYMRWCEVEYLKRSLGLTGKNKSKLAERLKRSRSKLSARMNALGVTQEGVRRSPTKPADRDTNSPNQPEL